ncbi:hypothetical protein BKA61DRAFT_585762, partial [Leptodontidium sp. MPI-SDFR-AT-0119]
MFRINCCIIDFGHADFQSQLSIRSWKEKCDSDEAQLNDIFREAEAQLVVTLGLRFLQFTQIDILSQSLSRDTEADLDAADVLDKYDHPCKEGNYIESLLCHTSDQSSLTLQTRLAILLRFASYQARAAIPLIDTILSLVPDPLPLLALSLIDILLAASCQTEATALLNTQLSNPSLPVLFLARFHERKIQVLISGGNILQAQIAAIETAMPILVKAYGLKSFEVITTKYKLGTAWMIMGDKERTKEIYREVERELSKPCGETKCNSMSVSVSVNVNRECSEERNEESNGGEKENTVRKLLKTWRQEVTYGFI